MSVSIVIRKGIGRSLVNLVEYGHTRGHGLFKEVDMFHIILAHSLFFGNHNGTMDLCKDFLLMYYLIYLLTNKYLLYILGYLKKKANYFFLINFKNFVYLKVCNLFTSQTPNSGILTCSWLILKLLIIWLP